MREAVKLTDGVLLLDFVVKLAEGLPLSGVKSNTEGKLCRDIRNWKVWEITVKE